MRRRHEHELIHQRRAQTHTARSTEAPGEEPECWGRVHWAALGSRGFSGEETGGNDEDGQQQHGAASAASELGAGSDRHSYPVRARSLTSPGPGEAGGAGARAGAQQTGGRCRHGHRHTQAAAQHLRA